MRHESNSSSNPDEWITPPHILKALGEFDLDPCASHRQPWPTAARMLTENDNGLLQEWRGRVWLNPPFGRETEKWVKRLADHQNGVALIFARTDTGTFFNAVWDHASAIFFLKGRVRFYRFLEDGTLAPLRNSPAPAVLVSYDSERETTFNAQALQYSGLDGYYVDLSDARVVWRGWRSVVLNTLLRAGEPLPLQEIYTRVLGAVVRPSNNNIKPKIRQILYIHEGRYFRRVGDRWTVAA